MEYPISTNKQVFCVSGEANTGKTASLMGLEQEGVLYLNCDSGKRPPFSDRFHRVTGAKESGVIIKKPEHVLSGIRHAEASDVIHTVVIDPVTFLLDMYYSVNIRPAANPQAMWMAYAEFWRDLMFRHVAVSNKRFILLAHTEKRLNEETATMEQKIPVMGKVLAKNGLEAYFSTIVTTRRMRTIDLEAYENPLLVITEDEEELGYKYVFQTRPTKETVGNLALRAPIGMWERQETFIDNNCQLVMDRLDAFYNQTGVTNEPV